MDDTSAVFHDIMLVFSVAVLYCLMLVLGLHLKRSHGVRVSDWTYHLFSLCLSAYIPAKLLQMRLAFPVGNLTIPFRQAMGAGMCFFGALVAIALVDRYVWDLYFTKRNRVKVPKFLSEV